MEDEPKDGTWVMGIDGNEGSDELAVSLPSEIMNWLNMARSDSVWISGRGSPVWLPPCEPKVDISGRDG
jgi:hypothetical protein